MATLNIIAHRCLIIARRSLLTKWAGSFTRTRVVMQHPQVKPIAVSYRFFKTSPSSLSTSLTPEAKSHLDQLVQKDKVVVFMKGVPDAPRCGFSNAVAQILRMHGVSYASYDVLSDESLRQNIKEYSKWPTIPQVYINGTFVGGCDILLQMHRTGELIETLNEAGITSTLKEDFNPDSSNKCQK